MAISCLTHAQEDHTALVLGLEARKENGGSSLKISKGDSYACSCYLSGEEVKFFVAAGARADIYVISAQNDTSEFLVGVCVFHGDAAAGEDRCTLDLRALCLRANSLRESSSSGGEGVRPRGFM